MGICVYWDANWSRYSVLGSFRGLSGVWAEGGGVVDGMRESGLAAAIDDGLGFGCESAGGGAIGGGAIRNLLTKMCRR